VPELSDGSQIARFSPQMILENQKTFRHSLIPKLFCEGFSLRPLLPAIALSRVEGRLSQGACVEGAEGATPAATYLLALGFYSVFCLLYFFFLCVFPFT